MKIPHLQQILKQPSNAGSESSQLLDKFLLYCKLIQDPLNVFRYMQQKSICTYFPLFWYTKSEYLFELGDYKNSFACLNQAQSRIGMNDQDQNQKIIDTQLKAKIYRQHINGQILKFPRQRIRSTSDFQVMNLKYQQLPGTDQQKNQQISLMIQTKFPNIKLQKQKKFYQKNQQKPKSWLYEHYQQQKQKMFQIIHQTIKSIDHNKHQDSHKPQIKTISNNQRLFKSVNTPFKRRDPMRMIKTVDSVQMMKRKRKQSNQKFLKSPQQKYLQDSQQQQNIFDDSNGSINICMNTVPVSGRFAQMKNKKQVKFQKSSPLQFEKLRNQSKSQQPFIQISRKTSVHKKGILRNKETNDGQEKILLNNTISQMKIKKCQQRFL